MALTEQFPQGLEDILGWGGITSSQRYNTARQNQGINQQGALQEMFWKDQTTPVDIDYKKALTGQTLETTRGMGIKNDYEDRIKDDRYKAELSKFATQITDDDLKQAENAIKQLRLSPSAEERKVADMLMEGFSDVVKHKHQQKSMMDRQLELEEMRGENQRRTAQAKAAATTSKPMTMTQLEAMLRQKAAEGDETAIQSLAVLEADKRAKAAAGAMVGEEFRRELLGAPSTTEDRSSTGKVAPTAPTKYEKGKQYTGRTGTYEYLGGPEADPKSWKKVK
jgi:hypothetical protein